MPIAPPTQYLPTNATLKPLKGGYAGWAFIKEGELEQMASFTDAADWTTLIGKNTTEEVFIFGRFDCENVKGQKGDINEDNIQTGNCQVETTRTSTVEFTFEDEAEDTAFSNFNPYEFIRFNYLALRKDYVLVVFDGEGNMTAGRDHSSTTLPVIGYSINALGTDHSSGNVDTDARAHTLRVVHKADAKNISFKPVPTAIADVADSLHANVS